MNIIYQFRKDGKYGMSTFLHNCLGAGLQGEGTSYSTIESVNTLTTDLGRFGFSYSALPLPFTYL